MRNSKQILLASRQFAHEQPARSWWHLFSTLAALAALLSIASTDLPWLLRLPFSVMAGLLIVRFFILFHDHQHGAILRGSKIADWIMLLFGLATLSPPSVWKRSHDHHHRNNSRTFHPNIGSYPLLTVDEYAAASRWERWQYVMSRHPLTMAFANISVFLIGMCLLPLLAHPRKHFDALLALALHGLLLWLVADDLWLVGVIPFAVGTSVGAYLFFAQHNFPGVQFRVDRDWDYVFAAMHSSSYIAMGPTMSWFTGNIGYHHVHHLNDKIPFYRLPEAMAAISELKCSGTTSLRPRDVVACLRLKLWDPATRQLVNWPRRVAKATIGYQKTTLQPHKKASSSVAPGPTPV